MNDFHILSLCIKNNDINGAMLVFRDKSEFVARKILERIKVKLPVDTGRQFWCWLQNWLMNECRNETNFNEPDSSPSFATAESIMSGQSESGSTGRSQNHGASVHAGRSHQHAVSGETGTSAVPTLVFPAVVVMLARDLVPDNIQRFMPRHFFYFAYAGHLLLAGMLLLWMPARA